MALVFMVALLCATPVEAKNLHRWESVSYINPFGPYSPENPSVSGEILREDGTTGSVYWVNTDEKVMHGAGFGYGYWMIEWDDGLWIRGTHRVTVRYSNAKIVGNGKVTDASQALTPLIGRNAHYSGIIDWSFLRLDGVMQIS